jgi:glycosyltransferase involved in cell wall biosynthesis
VVVVDGASASIEQVLSSAQTPYALRWFVQPHQGETTARNRALRESRGDVILSLDDDTVPVPRFVELHLRRHQQEDGIVVIGGVKNHPQSPEWLLAESVGWTRGWQERLLTPGFQPSHLHLPDGNFSVRRELLLRAGGWEEALKGYGGIDDAELGYRLVRSGLKLQVEPEALVYHKYSKPLPALLSHARVAGQAQVFYFERYPDRVADLMLCRFLTGPWWMRAMFGAARWIPGGIFSFTSRRLAPRLHTRRWPRNALTRSFIKFLWGMFLFRGHWEHPQARQAVAAVRARNSEPPIPRRAL